MNIFDQSSYFSVLIFPLLIFAGYFSGHPYVFLMLLFLLLGLAELIDYFLPRDKQFSIDLIDTQDNFGKFELNLQTLILFIYPITHIALIITGLYFAQFHESTATWILYAIPVGISGAIALNITHELMHKNNKFEAVIAKIIGIIQFMSINEYEHLYVHHRNDISCTEEDIGCARIGQSVYSYNYHIIRAVMRHAWEIEKENLQRANKPVFSFNNRVIIQVSLSILLTLAIFLLLGGYALLFFLFQCLASVGVYYLFPYNQHYGLLRHKNNQGQYEEFTFMNTWSSDRWLTNRLFFNLPRHSHHHLYSFCRYYDLKTIKNSPLLPAGYLGTLFLCLIPPLWYKVMDGKVAKVFTARDAMSKQGIL